MPFTLPSPSLPLSLPLSPSVLQGPEVLSKWVGESEKAVRTLFSRAAASAPSVIFIDEIDGMVSARRATGSTGVGDRVLLQLLQEMDGRCHLLGGVRSLSGLKNGRYVKGVKDSKRV